MLHCVSTINVCFHFAKSRCIRTVNAEAVIFCDPTFVNTQLAPVCCKAEQSPRLNLKAVAAPVAKDRLCCGEVPGAVAYISQHTPSLRSSAAPVTMPILYLF